MLITSPRHTAADLDLWRDLEDSDHVRACASSFADRVRAAQIAIRDFATRRCYVGVSWGKDSVVVAHLAESYNLPLVWVRVEPIANPDCVMVRDAFLEVHGGVTYEEVVIECKRDEDGPHASGTLERGFAIATARYGDRYVSGVRAEESGARTMRARTFGTTTDRTCAPLSWWTTGDVFAYLAEHDLPVHPVYAMTGGGRWPREHLRVASLGGKRGAGMGRAEWELEYYGDELRRIAR